MTSYMYLGAKCPSYLIKGEPTFSNTYYPDIDKTERSRIGTKYSSPWGEEVRVHSMGDVEDFYIISVLPYRNPDNLRTVDVGATFRKLRSIMGKELCNEDTFGLWMCEYWLAYADLTNKYGNAPIW